MTRFPFPPPLPARRYSEIAELVVTAAQRRALQQRAARQGVALVPGEGGPVVKVGLAWLQRHSVGRVCWGDRQPPFTSVQVWC